MTVEEDERARRKMERREMKVKEEGVRQGKRRSEGEGGRKREKRNGKKRGEGVGG